MNIKSYIFGSVATFAIASAAHATDAVVPDPFQSADTPRVSACDAYGIGFISVAGTDTCMRVSGQLRYEKHFSNTGHTSLGRSTLDFETRSD